MTRWLWAICAVVGFSAGMAVTAAWSAGGQLGGLLTGVEVAWVVGCFAVAFWTIYGVGKRRGRDMERGRNASREADIDQMLKRRPSHSVWVEPDPETEAW